MGYYDIYTQYKEFDFEYFLSGVTDEDIKESLYAESLDSRQFLTLLSYKAKDYLEEMALRSQQLTIQYFGKAIQLYTPLYLSNYCSNQCLYCGFSRDNGIRRKKLSLDELEREAQFISSQGLQHILLLTGGSRKESPLTYIKECIRVARKYFSSISIEIYALTSSEYREVIEEGADGLTIYQEIYDENSYNDFHPLGEKKDYLFRMDAPERAASNGMRTINIGTLLGLGQWQKESFFTGLHAKYLQDKFSDTEVSLSIPRLRPQVKDFSVPHNVTDEDIVQIICALRLFLPRVGITLSTRESARLRDNLIPLGITRMSAGSTTAVGGHTITDNDNLSSAQFKISDERDVNEVKRQLLVKGYQPVLKDWMHV